MSATDKPPAKSALLAILITVLALALLGYVLWYVDQSPKTDDAYVYADTVNVVPEVSGRIVELPVRDNQLVKRGDVLLRIDPRQYEAALMQARARLIALDKQIELTQRTVNAQKYNAQSASAAVERVRALAKQASDTLRRTEPLLSQGYASAEEVDRARTAQRSAQAELNATLLQARQAAAAVSGADALVAQKAVVQAEIAVAELNIEFATVRAPFNGRVVALKTTVGQFASALKPVFTLIDSDHWYVVANFRETALRNIRAGTPSTVYLMSDTSKHFEGVVDSVSYGVLPEDGGVVLEGLPRVQRSINWVHVSQRIPVKIRIQAPDPELFRVGASAVAILRRGGDQPSAQAGRK